MKRKWTWPGLAVALIISACGSSGGGDVEPESLGGGEVTDTVDSSEEESVEAMNLELVKQEYMFDVTERARYFWDEDIIVWASYHSKRLFLEHQYQEANLYLNRNLPCKVSGSYRIESLVSLFEENALRQDVSIQYDNCSTYSDQSIGVDSESTRVVILDGQVDLKDGVALSSSVFDEIRDLGGSKHVYLIAKDGQRVIDVQINDLSVAVDGKPEFVAKTLKNYRRDQTVKFLYEVRNQTAPYENIYASIENLVVLDEDVSYDIDVGHQGVVLNYVKSEKTLGSEKACEKSNSTMTKRISESGVTLLERELTAVYDSREYDRGQVLCVPLVNQQAPPFFPVESEEYKLYDYKTYISYSDYLGDPREYSDRESQVHDGIYNGSAETKNIIDKETRQNGDIVRRIHTRDTLTVELDLGGDGSVDVEDTQRSYWSSYLVERYYGIRDRGLDYFVLGTSNYLSEE